MVRKRPLRSQSMNQRPKKKLQKSLTQQIARLTIPLRCQWGRSYLGNGTDHIFTSGSDLLLVSHQVFLNLLSAFKETRTTGNFLH